MTNTSDQVLYCTYSHRQAMPSRLRSHFRDLDQLLRDLLSSAHRSLVVCAPYLSPAGIRLIRPQLAVSASRGAWIRLITSGLNEAGSLNRRAIETLMEGNEGALIKSRLRILVPVAAFTELVHAKFVIADAERGYLGSANISFGALENNFELGVAIDGMRARALADLVSHLEGDGSLVEFAGFPDSSAGDHTTGG